MAHERLPAHLEYVGAGVGFATWMRCDRQELWLTAVPQKLAHGVQSEKRDHFYPAAGIFYFARIVQNKG